ncbi:Recombination protein RecR [Azospirillaceae bacterium]
MISPEIDRLIQILARLPGLGPRSARRVALQLMKRRETLLSTLIESLVAVAHSTRACTTCGNLDTDDPCALCRNEDRDQTVICVVGDVGDLWALERTRAYHGLYHVLGGTLSAIDGIRPEELNITSLIARAASPNVSEVILALNATVEGQMTTHVVSDRLSDANVTISRLAQGVPLGGELDYLDDGTLAAALRTRRRLP